MSSEYMARLFDERAPEIRIYHRELDGWTLISRLTCGAAESGNPYPGAEGALRQIGWHVVGPWTPTLGGAGVIILPDDYGALAYYSNAHVDEIRRDLAQITDGRDLLLTQAVSALGLEEAAGAAELPVHDVHEIVERRRTID